MRLITALAITLVVAAATMPGCRRPPPRPDAPQPRLITYSPALTALVFDMGFGEHVVGVTTFCQPPAGNDDLAIVGNLAQISTEAILAVKPDVLLVQQNPAAFAAVTSIDPHVRIEHFTIETLGDVAAAIQRIGMIVGAEDLATRRARAFCDKLESIRQRTAKLPRPKVLFVSGYDRPGTGGAGTFIEEMIQTAGGINAPTQRGYSGWKTLNRENILAMAPDVLICLVPENQAVAAMGYWQSMGDLPAVKAGRIYTVADDRWMIPAAWSADFASQLAEILHPQIGPLEEAGD